MYQICAHKCVFTFYSQQLFSLFIYLWSYQQTSHHRISPSHRRRPPPSAPAHPRCEVCSCKELDTYEENAHVTHTVQVELQILHLRQCHTPTTNNRRFVHGSMFKIFGRLRILKFVCILYSLSPIIT